MDNKLTETLPAWIAPRLMRLNHADGTEKHVLITESASCPSGYYATTTGGGFANRSGGGGNGVCAPGPS